jgi:hypothetical protein
MGTYGSLGRLRGPDDKVHIGTSDLGPFKPGDAR